jgi:hypothetical protein
MVIGTTRSTHAPNLLSDQVVSDRALTAGSRRFAALELWGHAQYRHATVDP